MASTGWSAISIPYTGRPGTSSWVSTARTPGIATRRGEVDRRGCARSGAGCAAWPPTASRRPGGRRRRRTRRCTLGRAVGAQDALADAAALQRRAGRRVVLTPAPARSAAAAPRAISSEVGRSAARRPRPPARRSPAAPRPGAAGPGPAPTTGSAMPAWPAPSRRQRAMSASLPGSSEPISSSRPEAAGAVDGAERERRPRRHGGRARRAGAPRGAPRAAPRPARRDSLEAAPSTPSPTATPAAARSAAGAMPEPRRALEDGQWATEVPVAARRAISSGDRWTQCASQTSGPEPVEVVEVLDRAHAEALEAEAPPPRRSRPGGCAGARRGAGARAGRLGHQLPRHRERRARGRRRSAASPRARGRASGRSPPRWRRGRRRGPRPPRPAAARPASAPRSIEPRHGWKRRPSSGRRAIVAREQRRRRRAGTGSGGPWWWSSPTRASAARRRAGRRVDDLLVDPRPARVERGEPAEEVLRPGAQPAGRPLVEVVVAVDEARAWRGRPRPSMRRAALGAGGGAPAPRAAMRGPSTRIQPSACSVPAASTVGDRAALDEHGPLTRAPRAEASRTASRIFS